MKDYFYLIPHIALLFLALGFIGFMLMISQDFRRMLKRNRKIAKRKNNIKQASKARDFQI
jgi:hypothetical protein